MHIKKRYKCLSSRIHHHLYVITIFLNVIVGQQPFCVKWDKDVKNSSHLSQDLLKIASTFIDDFLIIQQCSLLFYGKLTLVKNFNGAHMFG